MGYKRRRKEFLSKLENGKFPTESAEIEEFNQVFDESLCFSDELYFAAEALAAKRKQDQPAIPFD